MSEDSKTKPIKKPKADFFFNEEKEYLIENLSMLVNSGMDVASALLAVRSELKTKKARTLVDYLVREVSEGVPLWTAFSQSESFPNNIISLVKLGEQAGQLPKNLKAIAIRERKERNFRSKVRSAMLYPIFVFTLTLVIGVGIAWFLLPKLANVFSSLDLELPWITRTLISFGTFLKAYGVLAIPLFLFFSALFFYIIFFFPRTRFIGEKILFLIPATRNLIQQIELSRFGYALATLVDAGLSLTDSIESLRDATTFVSYRRFYQHLLESVSQGNSFQASFDSFQKGERLIPRSVQQMVAFAEQSGNLVPTFREIGENYEEKLETTTKDLATLLEPVMLVIVWLGVVGVALAVILPIYRLIGGLSEQTNPTAPAQTVEEAVEAPASPEAPPVEEPKTEVNVEIVQPEPVPVEAAAVPEYEVEIQPTETGFLNVRDIPSAENSQVISRVKPGERYKLLSEQDGWFQIRISDSLSGWVSAQYAIKIADGQ